MGDVLILQDLEWINCHLTDYLQIGGYRITEVNIDDIKAFEEKPVVTLLSPGIVSKKIDFDNFTKEKIFQIAWRSYFRKISHKKFGKWKICFQLN